MSSLETFATLSLLTSIDGCQSKSRGQNMADSSQWPVELISAHIEQNNKNNFS
jgi:hypothetical protein